MVVSFILFFILKVIKKIKKCVWKKYSWFKTQNKKKLSFLFVLKIRLNCKWSLTNNLTISMIITNVIMTTSNHHQPLLTTSDHYSDQYSNHLHYDNRQPLPHHFIHLWFLICSSFVGHVPSYTRGWWIVEL